MRNRFLLSSITIACILVAAACEEKKSEGGASSSTSAAPTSSPSPKMMASAPATTSAGPSPSVAPSASSSAVKTACDFTIVPGDRITTPTGDQKLAGTTAVKIDVESGKSYCVFGGTLTRASTLKDGTAIAPADCKTTALIGATHIECEKQGVALTFAGPPGIFSRVTIYPPGGPAGAASAKSSK